jgi:hypothetical protein
MTNTLLEDVKRDVSRLRELCDKTKAMNAPIDDVTWAAIHSLGMIAFMEILITRLEADEQEGS